MNLFRRKSTTTAATKGNPMGHITTASYPLTLGDPPAPEPAALPDSAIVAEAARIIAKCRELAGSADIVSHPAGNQPLPVIRLTAAANNLRLRAAGFGDARDVAAAELAVIAARELESVWLAGTAPAPPVERPAAPERVPAEDFGVHTAGRPAVGQVVHIDREEGVCKVGWVVELLAGGWASGIVTTSENPYIRVAAIEDPTRPVFARWVPKPVKNLSPGYRKEVTSYHRPGNECGGSK